MKKKIRTYYDVLGIGPDATDFDVRASYRALARIWHPDRNPMNRTEAEQRFQLIHKAYMFLKTAPQRDAYDRRLKAEAMQKVIAGNAKNTPPAREKNIQKLQRKSREVSVPREPGMLSKTIVNLKEILWPIAPAQNDETYQNPSSKKVKRYG